MDVRLHTNKQTHTQLIFICLILFIQFLISLFIHLLIIRTEWIFRRILFSVASVIFFSFFFYVCGHNNSWKAQPIRTKFWHMTFDWNSSGKFENGHRRSHVIPPNGGFCPPWFTYLRFQPCETINWCSLLYVSCRSCSVTGTVLKEAVQL